MSDPPSQPPQGNLWSDFKTLPLPAPTPLREAVSTPHPTTSVGTLAMPWDPMQHDDPEARRRDTLRRQYGLSNPYTTANHPPLVDRTSSRSRSPIALSPLRQRTPLLKPSSTSKLPPLSDMLLGPCQGITSKESFVRSTTYGSSETNTMSSTTPTHPVGGDSSVERQPRLTLPPFSDLPSPSGLTPFSTPCPTRQDDEIQHRPISPATADPGQGDTAHQETGPAVKEEEMEVEPQEPQDDALMHPVICEFSSPCRMTPSPDGMHYRKVVSHVFGRNKASTKLFPDSVWVHYCRKHYQRARYRADQWPFTQCELLLESLNRMQEWGGVQRFELILRRREMLRVEDGESSGNRAAGSSNTLQSGRKHPTAIVSPVPDWLHQRRGRDMSFDDIRNLVAEIRGHMVQLREEEKERQGERENAAGSGSASNRSNDASYKSEARQEASRVRFPDVEILPKFKKWVIDAALRKRATQQQVTEVADDEEDEEENLSDIGDDEADEDDKSTPTAEVGRTGTNTGVSQSQRRRSERIFIRMVEGKGASRVSPRGAVQKPRRQK